MARIPPILYQIRNAQGHSEQAAALRSLKDEIIGHVQQKEKWVEYGVLEPIVEILEGARPTTRWNGKEPHYPHADAPGLTEDEKARLQALQLLASFAKGGASFLAPLTAANAIPEILSNISPRTNPPQIVLTALRALNSLAEATSLVAPPYEDAASLADAIFGPRRNLKALYDILTSTSTTHISREQKSLVTSLISRLCKDARHQNALANAGILDALATMLASFVVARGEVVPGAEDQEDDMAEFRPAPAPRGAKLTETLAALEAIIEDSRFRATLLLCSPAIMAVFPSVAFAPNAGWARRAQETREAWSALQLAGLSTYPIKDPGAMDYLLPVVPGHQPKGQVNGHSVLAPSSHHSLSDNLQRLGTGAWDSALGDTNILNDEAESDDAESPLVPWLIHLVRSTIGLERVLAASILASLFSAGLVSPEREATIGLVVVPVLCQTTKEYDRDGRCSAADSPIIDQETALHWAILERTPAVLARLLAESEYLQQSAYESDIVKVVCRCLKHTYDLLPAQAAPKPWSPTPDRWHDRGGEGLAANRVGPPGQLPIYAHRIKMRESALKLIASMASFNEELRKAIVGEESMPYIVESLFPVPTKPKAAKDRPKAEKGLVEEPTPASGFSLYGNNPDSVITAACHVVRALGRSVSIIRTHLEDYAVASPIFALLRHPDVTVQIAACATVCNLVLEVSPMRAPLINAGILDVLCKHAHSLNPGLRLNSMWALKHLVHTAENDLKKKALEQLGSGWLVQLITADTEDEALYTRTRRKQEGEDEDMTEASPDTDEKPWCWSAIARLGPGKEGFHRVIPLRMQQADRRLIALRDTEMNPVRKARNDDIAIQEQGLEFIRNLIGMPSSGESNPETTSDMTEMVDYIFTELGQDQLFDILLSKLRFKVLRPFTRRNSAARGNDSRVIYPQAKVIESVVLLLVHLAASIPRHRQLVISQTDLLKQLVQQLGSKDAEVRKALCHLLYNLAWQEDADDAEDCTQRTLELKRLGFLTKLEVLVKADRELDVRERAKLAAFQIEKGPQI